MNDTKQGAHQPMKLHAHEHPHNQASPQGEAALWGGPLSQEGRPHVAGSSRGAKWPASAKISYTLRV